MRNGHRHHRHRFRSARATPSSSSSSRTVKWSPKRSRKSERCSTSVEAFEGDGRKHMCSREGCYVACIDLGASSVRWKEEAKLRASVRLSMRSKPLSSRHEFNRGPTHTRDAQRVLHWTKTSHRVSASLKL